jgi:hypothetical protein
MEVRVPSSLKYGAVYSQSKINRVSLMPSSQGPFYPSNTVRFNLPSRSLIRLSSLSAYFTATITGLTSAAANSSNAQIPYAGKLFSRVQFYVNGIPVNNSNYHDLVAVALAKCSGSPHWAESRAQSGALDLIQLADDCDVVAQRVLTTQNTATSKTQYMVFDEIIGIPNCNGGGGVLDCGVWGDVSVEFTLNDAQCLKVKTNGDHSAVITGVSYNLNDFTCGIDVITSVSNDYLSMMELRLKDPRPINFAFQNYSAQVSLNSGSVRHAVATNCLDIVMCAPLKSTWQTRATQASTDVEGPRYSFDSNRSLADANTARLSFNIGSTQYPQSQIANALQVLDITQNCFAHGDRGSTHLLCNGVSGVNAADKTVSRTHFLENNFILAFPLSSESEGWASHDKVLSGISTNQANAEIIVNSSNIGDAGSYLFTCALYTSVLEYDPATANVRVIA